MEHGALRRQTPRLFSELRWLPRRWGAAALVAAAAALLLPLGAWAASHHPSGRATDGALQARVAKALCPSPQGDDTVVGDLLVERFYAVDADDGGRVVADVVKGRVSKVETWTHIDGTNGYSLALDRNGLQAEAATLRRYIPQVAPPAVDSDVAYLGISVPGPGVDGMQINYDGSLPIAHEPFKLPAGRHDVYDYLANLRYADASGPAQLMPSRGYNYLLSNTEQWPYFRSLFGVDKAVFVSELVLVDMTSTPDRETFFDLLSQ